MKWLNWKRENKSKPKNIRRSRGNEGQIRIEREKGKRSLYDNEILKGHDNDES